MTGGRWIALGAALALGFGLWLMWWHTHVIAPLRAMRAEAAACADLSGDAHRSMSRMLESVEEVNAEARDLRGREVFTINGIVLEVRQ